MTWYWLPSAVCGPHIDSMLIQRCLARSQNLHAGVALLTGVVLPGQRGAGGSQALDVAPVAFDDVDEVIHVAVFPEEHLSIVDLVLLHRCTLFRAL